MKIKVFTISTIAIVFALISCVNSNSSKSNSSVTNQNNASSSNSNNTSNEPKCNCKKSDIESLANKFMSNFDQVQNNLSSDIARTISLESISDNGNCTWHVKFRISWPFGNTDGAHPDEYISKTGTCDANEVYLQ